MSLNLIQAIIYESCRKTLLVMSKICVICNEDCSNEPRFKNEDGAYIHQQCYVAEDDARTQQSAQPVKSMARHSLKLSSFYYCEFCDRPVKANEYLKWRYHERRNGNQDRTVYTIYSCTQCGKRVYTINFHHVYTTLTGLCVAVVLFPPWTWLSIRSFSKALLVIGVYALGWFLWWLLSIGLRTRKRRFKDILNRWVVTHGANSSAWPALGRDWVDEHGANPSEWPGHPQED